MYATKNTTARISSCYGTSQSINRTNTKQIIKSNSRLFDRPRREPGRRTEDEAKRLLTARRSVTSKIEGHARRLRHCPDVTFSKDATPPGSSRVARKFLFIVAGQLKKTRLLKASRPQCFCRRTPPPLCPSTQVRCNMTHQKERPLPNINMICLCASHIPAH